MQNENHGRIAPVDIEEALHEMAKAKAIVDLFSRLDETNELDCGTLVNLGFALSQIIDNVGAIFRLKKGGCYGQAQD